MKKFTAQGTPDLAYKLINKNSAYSVPRGTATDTEVVIPETYQGLPVIEIANSGFECYSSMTSIIVPECITTIGEYAFSGCVSLTDINILNSVTSIGKWAFSGCNNLTMYTAHPSQPAEWEADWNSCNRPVVWGYIK